MKILKKLRSDTKTKKKRKQYIKHNHITTHEYGPHGCRKILLGHAHIVTGKTPQIPPPASFDSIMLPTRVGKQ